MEPTKKWHTREESGLELDEDVCWWHDGERVEHPNIIEAFNKGLSLEPDGRFKLTLGNDWAFVKVARCAFRVVAVDVSEGQRLSVRLSDRTAEWLNLEALELDAQGRFVVKVKDGRALALFSRDAQHQLGAMLEVEGERYVAVVEGRRWPTTLRTES